MSWDAEKALREGIETQRKRVESLKGSMESYKVFYKDYKRWYDKANGHLQNMLELEKQRKELK